MKILEIINKKTIGFLLYFEDTKDFYIELKDNLLIKDVPIFFDYYIENKIKFIDSYHSLMFVRERIIPSNRQNINSILKSIKSSLYDEYEMLVAYKGKSCQDDVFVRPISYSKIDSNIKKRLQNRILDVVPQDNRSLILFLFNGDSIIIDLNILLKNNKCFDVIFKNDEIFYSVDVSSFGFGVNFGSNLFIPYDILCKNGKKIEIKMDSFIEFSKRSFLETSDVCDSLNCSRQNVSDLIKRNKLKVTRKSKNNAFFIKSDVNNRKWKIS